MAEINDWKEIKIDDWKEVPIGNQQPPPMEQDKPFSFGNMISNAPKSFFENVVQPAGQVLFQPGPTVRHLIEAVKEPSRTWEAIKKPYTSWDEFIKTVEQDPFRPLVDASIVAGGVGGALKTAGAITKTGWLGQAGETIGKAGAWTDPVYLGEKVAGLPLKLLPKSTIDNLYKGVLKPKSKKEFPPEQVQASIDYAHENHVLINDRGLKKIEQITEAYNDTFDRIVKEAKRTGDTLRSDDVLGYLDSTEKLFGSVAGGDKFLAEIQKVRDDFLNRLSTKENTVVRNKQVVPISNEYSSVQANPSKYSEYSFPSSDLEKAGPVNYLIPVEKALEVKQAIYAVQKKAYGELSSATKEAQKAIARGIKDEMIIKYQNDHPELRQIGLNERDAIKLEHMISDRLGVTTRKDLISLGEITGGVGGGIAIGGPGAIASILTLRMLKDPTIMSYLSNKLYSIKKHGIRPSDYWLGTRQRIEAINKVNEVDQP